MSLKTKRLLEKYNQPGTVLVVSSYPEKGIKYGNQVCAVGGFTKNTLEALKNLRFAVLTVRIDKEEAYEEDGVLVWRVFERNNPFSYLKLSRAIGQFSQVNTALVEYEFASYGNTLTSALFPLALIWLRLLGKNATLVLHQVVDDLESISGHLGWKKKTAKSVIFNSGLRVFYWLMVFTSHQVVVLEEVLRKKLSSLVGMEEKIRLIPHGVDRQQNIFSRSAARKRLGIRKNEPVILYFGYLTWYKGADLLVKAFANNNFKSNNKPIRLIVAGGESATQKEKANYRQFVKNVYRLASKSERVNITGFVDQKDLPLYFAAADLVVLPYRTFMSSSGPLSLAFSFNKPVLMSSALQDYFVSPDFKESMKNAKVKKEDIIFPLRQKALITKIESSLAKDKLAKLAKFSSLMARQREFSALAPAYIKALNYRPSRAPSLLFKLALRRV